MSEGHAGRLFVVSTPIGNMGDFSFRAVEILREVSLILCEDTRTTRHLLDRYEIDSPVAAHHAHNEAASTKGAIAKLETGSDVALVTDAGTPLLSDPGERLVRAAIDAGIRVIPIPGASALLAALVGSGLEADRFVFFGFLDRKGKDRRSAIAELVASPYTAVIYESPNRVAETLAELASAGAAERASVVARELTKHFEEFRRGTVTELSAYYRESPPKGEVVILLAGAAPTEVDENAVRARARELIAAGHSARDVARYLQDEMGVSRNVAYRMAQETT